MSGERHELSIYAYEEWPDLYVYRCTSCGSTGPEGSECKGHDAPMASGADSLAVKRMPVLVPHPEEGTSRFVFNDDVSPASTPPDGGREQHGG